MIFQKNSSDFELNIEPNSLPDERCDCSRVFLVPPKPSEPITVGTRYVSGNHFLVVLMDRYLF